MTNLEKSMEEGRRQTINGIVYLLLFIMGFLFLSVISSAQLDSLGTAKINEQYTFCQVCSDSSYITLSSIQTPNSTEQIDSNLTQVGSGQWCYNYTPIQLGRYDFRGISDGCTGEFATYLEITSTGSDGINGQIILYILLGLAAFFLIMSIFGNTEFFLYVSGVVFILAGIYSMIYGIGIIADWYTQAVATVTIGLGFILIVGAYLDGKWEDRSEYEEESD